MPPYQNPGQVTSVKKYTVLFLLFVLFTGELLAYRPPRSPGVYVEEIDGSQRKIEGVPTGIPLFTGYTESFNPV